MNYHIIHDDDMSTKFPCDKNNFLIIPQNEKNKLKNELTTSQMETNDESDKNCPKCKCSKCKCKITKNIQIRSYDTDCNNNNQNIIENMDDNTPIAVYVVSHLSSQICMIMLALAIAHYRNDFVLGCNCLLFCIIFFPLLYITYAIVDYILTTFPAK